MRFLLTQIIIIILIFIFIAALSNLTELGVVGWIIAGSTGHALFRIYKLLHNSFRTPVVKGRYSSNDPGTSDYSAQLYSFMFDDVTRPRDD